MANQYKVGSFVRFSDSVKLSYTRKGSNAYRAISQNRTGTVVAFFGTALQWRDRCVTVKFPAQNGKQKDIIFHDMPVHYFEEVT